MPKNNVTRMDQARQTRHTDFGATKGEALVKQVLNGFTYASPDAETAANETRQDWQAIIADKLLALQSDIGDFLEDINFYDERYGHIAGDSPLMQAVGQLGRTLSDAAQDHDTVWADSQDEQFAARIAQQERDDAWAMRCWYGNEMSDSQY